MRIVRPFFEDFSSYFEDFSAVKITAKSLESPGKYLFGKKLHLEFIEFNPKVRILNYKRSDHILEYEFKFKFSLSLLIELKILSAKKLI